MFICCVILSSHFGEFKMCVQHITMFKSIKSEKMQKKNNVDLLIFHLILKSIAQIV